MSKAVILVIPDDAIADNICKLIEATMSLNGYRTDKPGVINWPINGDSPGSEP